MSSWVRRGMVAGCVFAVLMAIPSGAVAGDMDYPPKVAAARDGSWSAVINITSSTDPEWDWTDAENTSLNVIRIVHTPGTHTWKVTLGGTLVHLRREGSVSFKAKINGVWTTGKLTINAPFAPIPTLSQWAAIGMTLLLLTGATIVFFRKRGSESPVA